MVKYCCENSVITSHLKSGSQDGDAGGVMTSNHRHSNGSAFDEGVLMSVRRAARAAAAANPVVARVEPKDPDVVYSSRRSNGYRNRNGTRSASFLNPLLTSLEKMNFSIPLLNSLFCS